jgi:hypothetical protein
MIPVKKITKSPKRCTSRRRVAKVRARDGRLNGEEVCWKW